VAVLWLLLVVALVFVVLLVLCWSLLVSLRPYCVVGVVVIAAVIVA